ncbi:MAG: bifunctional lysylphosphatidylglycerol flippase/synthetase MprF [Synergistaceae bacterium]|nr:bifunctional lysylphosphatidylglycerol flippase/synthetase MprF [Synergistaceae bacterium]
MEFLRSRKIVPAIGLIITAITLYFIHTELSQYRFEDIRAAVASIPWYRLIVSLVFMFVNYAVLTLNDALALRYIGKALSWSRIAFVSFISNVLSFNLGMSLLTGGSSRYGIYSSYGLSASETAKILAFCSLSVWLGSAGILGVLLLLEPAGIIAQIPLLKVWGRIPGLLLVSFVVLSGFLSWSGKSVRLFGYDISLPPLGYFFAQMSISLLDFLCASLVLFSLLPHSGITSFHFIGCYVISVLLGSLSQIPGGLGVLDSTLIVMLSPWYSGPDLIGALLVYRIIYYLLPLCLSVILLGWRQFYSFGRSAKNVTARAGKVFLAIYPQILSLGVFLSGTVLLFSSATPGLPERLSVLKELFPLEVLELSNFLSSLSGIAILLLAQGIRRRLRIAWVLTTVLLGAGIVLSLMKGLDYEEALFITILLIPLVATRKYFDRDSRLFCSGLSLAWMPPVGLVMASAAWLGYFSHKHGEFASQSIWKFALSGKAPWFLRASVSLSIVVLFLCLWKLFRARSKFVLIPSDDDMEKARDIVMASDQASAALALLGDKSFCFSPSGKSMIFFAEEGSYWFAMGDPVGDQEEFRDLIWSFREHAAMNGAKVVFYEVTDSELPLYIEQGLVLVKIGESGRVPLEGLSFDHGHEWHAQRYTLRKLAKDGSSFRVIPSEDVPSVLPRLREISDQWLKSKQGREKGFSLGFFREEYIRQFKVAIVERQGEIQAFTNLWTSSDKNELSLDLMRHCDNAPADTMEFLFLNTILWAKAEGFAYFDLGMAPLSGITSGPHGSLWSRTAEMLYEHGNIFYNFQGLRLYKEKYHPIWEPRYLAVPHELSLPSVLATAAVLISKGPKGIKK